MLQFLVQHPVLLTLMICFFGAGLIVESQRRLLPLKIPATEVTKLAHELIDDFGPRAAEIAVARQERAIYNSDPFEEGKWRRVEKRIVSLQGSVHSQVVR